MYVNLSGDYDPVRLKTYAINAGQLEELPQINRVDIVGAPEREFQINVDNLRMQSAGVTFDDIAGAVCSARTWIYPAASWKWAICGATCS